MTHRESVNEGTPGFTPGPRKFSPLPIAVTLTRLIREHLKNCLRTIRGVDCPDLIHIVHEWAQKIVVQAPQQPFIRTWDGVLIAPQPESELERIARCAKTPGPCICEHAECCKPAPQAETPSRVDIPMGPIEKLVRERASERHAFVGCSNPSDCILRGLHRTLSTPRCHRDICGKPESDPVHLDLAVDSGRETHRIHIPITSEPGPEPCSGTDDHAPGECALIGASMDDKGRGLYRKFDVRRMNAESQERHKGCSYFVLDQTDDPHAIPALRAYAESCASDYSTLAADILRSLPVHAPEPPRAKHHCGLTGWNPMKDDPCPACAERAQPQCGHGLSFSVRCVDCDEIAATELDPTAEPDAPTPPPAVTADARSICRDRNLTGHCNHYPPCRAEKQEEPPRCAHCFNFKNANIHDLTFAEVEPLARFSVHAYVPPVLEK